MKFDYTIYPDIKPIDDLDNAIYIKLKEKYPDGLVSNRIETATEITQLALEHFKPLANKIIELSELLKENK